jgi:hypothetical protein
MDTVLKEIAIGIAQIQFWELGRKYRSLMAEHPEIQKTVEDWWDFRVSHRGETFLAFDPVDIRAMCNNDLKAWDL